MKVSNREEFNAMYWAHFPPEVHSLRPLIEEASHDAGKTPAVMAAAMELAMK